MAIVLLNQTPTQTQLAGSLIERYQALVLAHKPAAYWPMNEATGTSVLDISGHGNTGTIQGGVTLGQPGPIVGDPADTAMGFNGSNSYVQTGWQQNAVTAYTIVAWVNLPPTSSNPLPLISDWGDGSGLSLTLAAPGYGNSNANGVGFLLDSNDTAIGINTTETVADNTWHFVAGCWEAPAGTAVSPSQFALYVDGVLAATDSVSAGSASSPLTGNGGTTFMYDASWGYRAGNLAQVAIFQTVLDAATIQQLYLAGKTAITGWDPAGNLYTGDVMEHVYLTSSAATQANHGTGTVVTDDASISGQALEAIVGTSTPGSLLTWGQYQYLPQGPALLGVRAKVADNSSTETVLSVQPHNNGVSSPPDQQWGTNQWVPFAGQQFAQPNVYQWIWVPFYAYTPVGAYEFYTQFSGLTDVWIDTFVVITEAATGSNTLWTPTHVRDTFVGGRLVEAGSYPNTVLSLDPAAYWPLAVAVNGVTPDLSGNRNRAGVQSGVALNINGPFHQMGDVAMGFDGGSSSYIYGSLRAPSTSNGITVCAWYRPQGSGVIVWAGNNPVSGPFNAYGPVIWVNGTNLCLALSFSGTPDFVLSDMVVLDAWAFAAMTVDPSSTATALVNGVAQETASQSVPSWSFLSNVAFGVGYTAGWAQGNGGEYYFVGDIAHVAIFPYALSPAQVALLWNSGQGQFLDSTIPA